MRLSRRQLPRRGASKNLCGKIPKSRVTKVSSLTYRMEVHLWGEEGLISNFHRSHLALFVLVDVALELAGLDPLASGILFFLVKLGVLLLQIVANVAVLLFDLRRLVVSAFLTSVLVGLNDELGHVAASKRDVLHAGTNHKGVANGEDVRHTITCIDHSSRHVLVRKISALLVSLAHLGVECESGLNTDEKTLDVEGLKHDLSDLLAVLRSVHGGFSQNESVLFRVAPQVLMY